MGNIIFVEKFSDVGIDNNGRDKSKHFCPNCHDNRTDKRDKSLTVNYSKGVAFCHYCETTYAIKKEDNFKYSMKEYKKPIWNNKTELSDKLAKYFEGRMIPQSILKQLKITEGLEYMPQFGKDVNTVQFNYFVEGELVNVKYRTGDKKFKLCPDAELIPYNIDSTIGNSSVIFTEGEFDCMSFMAINQVSVVSVPNGASENTSYLDRFMESHFDDKEIIYIAVDTDNKGVILRNALIARFGAERCKIVEYGNDCKDANECLCSRGGGALRQCLDDAKFVPIEGVFQLSDVEADLDVLYEKGLEKGAEIGLHNFDQLCSFETKRLMIVTGIPTSGKTEFLEEVVIRLNLKYDWKVAFFSPESLPLSFHTSRIISRITGKRFGKDTLVINEYKQAKEYVSNNFFFVEPEKYDLDIILEKFKFLVRRRGVKVVVIDPYNSLSIGLRGNTADQVCEILDKMQRFARRNDVLFCLMAHPTKLQKGTDGKYPVPTLYDISGGANFFNKADFGITVQRNMDTRSSEIHVQKVKFRHLGSKGMANFAFNLNNGRFTEKEDPSAVQISWDNTNWLSRKIGIMEAESGKKELNFIDDISDIQSIYDNASSAYDFKEDTSPLPF